MNQFSSRHRLAAVLPVLFGVLLWTLPTRAVPPSPAPPVTPERATGDVVGTVEGIPITKLEWDHLALPYFKEVEARAGRKLTPDERDLLRKNVLEELVRERLWVADARRRGFTATEADVDARLGQNPFFRTNGKFDPAKFREFKFSPASNYTEIKAQVQNAVLLEKYSKWMQGRYTPSEAQLKKEFGERMAQASIRFLWLTPDVVSLERQASAEAVRAYYRTHPDEFQSPEEARVVYVRVPIEATRATSDTLRAVAELHARTQATAVLAQLKSGASIDAVAKPFGGPKDTGVFRVGDPIRGLGRSEELAAAVQSATLRQWIREPIRVGPYWIVARVEEHKRPAPRPFREAVAIAKRRADAQIQETELDSLARQEFAAHPDAYRVPLLRATVIARAVGSFDDPRPVSERDVTQTLERLRKSAGVSDTARAWADSVMKQLPDRVRRDRALAAGLRAMAEGADRWKRHDKTDEVARRLGGTVREIGIYKGQPPSQAMLLEGGFLDSLYTRSAGTIVGPRVSRDSVFIVRVNQVDDRFQPPFEAMRPAIRSALDARHLADLERDAQTYYDAHGDQYRTPPRWAFDYVRFIPMKPDSAPVPEDSIRAYYDMHPAEFTVPAKAHARHILIGVKPGDGPAAKTAARKKALDLLRRIRGGEDFEKLAKDFSEDRGSAAQGGDLGEITRGEVVKPFGDAVFSMKAGALSDLVETQFGYHIIRLESITPQRVRTIDEVRSEIHGVVGEAVAESLGTRDAWSFHARASKPGASFDDLAKPYGGAHKVPPVGAREPAQDLGVIPALETRIGSLPEGGVSVPIRLESGYVVALLTKTVPPHKAPFAEVKQEVVRDMQLERRKALADSIDAALREALRHGADIESLAVPLGGLRISRQFPRHGPVPELVRDSVLARDSTLYREVFASRPGTVLKPRRGALGSFYAVVDTVMTPSPKDYAQHREELKREILDQRTAAWTDRLRSKASIQIYRKDL